VRHSLVHRLQRLFAVISFAAFFAIALIAARIFGMELPWPQAPGAQSLGQPPASRQVVLISGHAGHDSGAVCSDDGGNILLTEAEVNARVSERAARLLRASGASVTVFDEYDPRLDDLEAALLLSIHADSCIDASGYKAAYYTYSSIPDIEQRILDCIDLHYADATGLAPHPDTVTHNMTEYHAFRRVAAQTPAAILELGFLGGDQELLTTGADRAARGVAESVLCFLRGGPTNTSTEATPGQGPGTQDTEPSP
jgi:N-acetylmuramoyl-L-alanine amidase